MSPLRFVATGRCRCDAPRGAAACVEAAQSGRRARTPIYCRSRRAAIARHAAPVSLTAPAHGWRAAREAACSRRLRVFVLQQFGLPGASPKHSSKRACGTLPDSRGEIGKRSASQWQALRSVAGQSASRDARSDRWCVKNVIRMDERSGGDDVGAAVSDMRSECCLDASRASPLCSIATLCGPRAVASMQTVAFAHHSSAACPACSRDVGDASRRSQPDARHACALTTV